LQKKDPQGQLPSYYLFRGNLLQKMAHGVNLLKLEERRKNLNEAFRDAKAAQGLLSSLATREDVETMFHLKGVVLEELAWLEGAAKDKDYSFAEAISALESAQEKDPDKA